MYPITPLEAVDYLVIGHITRDLTPDGPKLGGTAAYAALTAKSLGLRVGVVTSWGNDVPVDPMAGVTIVNQPAPHSTTFENIYSHAGRRQFIKNLAHQISATSIPEIWRNAAIVHLGPVAGELTQDFITHFPRSLTGVTPQGWLRAWDENGLVRPALWKDSSQVLRAAGVTILSLEDVGEDEDIIEEMAASSPVFVVTEGFFGARVYWHGDVRRFYAPEIEEVDATGAGDIFAAVFFTQYHKTRDPWESARFANQLAAQSVTRSGLLSVPTKEEIKKAIIEVL